MAQQTKVIWIDWLRVCAMSMIILCHIASQGTNSLGNIAAQFLNVGVELFFIISGYLLGRKRIQGSYGKWFCNRIIKLAPAYYLFLLSLFIIHLILHIHQHFLNWIISLFCLQGVEIYLLGGEHLWFLSVLLIDYAITPLLDYIIQKKPLHNKVFLFFLNLSVLFQIIATFSVSSQLGRYWFLVNLYIISYLIGAYDLRCVKKHQILCLELMGITAVFLRLVGRTFLDGTVMYNVLIVSLTHSILAFSIAAVFQYYIVKPVPSPIKFLSSISYEVYLIHYMFISGPISLMRITNSFLLNSVISITVSLMTAWTLHLIVHIIIPKVKR